ncbi:MULTISPECIES: SDR family NAD(P)-dependent oxidoreductase [Gammaproteobacteria]|uniref:SDR family NAD(P)-dependent oxidoreductase n=1 Tax=Gammaproteobacteria TaxID=1236 RepID=UPI000DCFC961|nr:MULTISPECIES: SDR family NAD(P)-dependent oxidoreductase [Gammaproteobacteria]RTE87321.1 SDR family NAD(P)-dependent oxidoreductase [Aliidiomarina sp. B3213]TCZ92893.1 SDR family NAD(P)-dependent oxidoreductase [Lysobacter sp. N42]
MKTVLITGATSGIGKQLALDYLAQGNKVIACGRNKTKLNELSQSSEGAGKNGECVLKTFDVTDRESVKDALSSENHIDCVILNAGVCEYVDDAGEMDSELFQRVFDANFMGVVNCASVLIPKLPAGSQLVVIDSMARLLPFTRAEAYGASKAAVHYFTNSLKLDLKSRGIRVTSVSPGFVKTPMTDANDFEMPFLTTVEEASKAIRKGIDKGKAQIYFPRVFGWALRFMSRLPMRLQVLISSRLDKE